MRYALFLLLLPVLGLADSLPVTYSCSTPGCTFPDGIQVISAGVSEYSGSGAVEIQQYAELSNEFSKALSDLPQGSPFTFNGQVSWKDPITLPALEPGYLYSIQMTTWGGQTYGQLPNTPGQPNGQFIGLEVNDATYTFGCDYNIAAPCPYAFSGTVPANAQVDVIGDFGWGCIGPCASITGGVGSVNGLDLKSSILIRTVTPEPLSYGLVVLGLGVVGLAAKPCS